MKYGPEITLKLHWLGCFEYRTHGRVVASFCAAEFRKAFGLVRYYREDLKVLAHDRPSKTRLEVHIQRVSNLVLVRVFKRNRWFKRWVQAKALHDLGIEPVADTYFWLEVKQ